MTSPRRGEVWLVDLGMAAKVRPALVISIPDNGQLGGHGKLELSAHLLKRMADRGFNEVDLRRMLEHASAHRPDIIEGRVVIEARHAGQFWDIIVEPDEIRQLLVVITAYPVEQRAS